MKWNFYLQDDFSDIKCSQTTLSQSEIHCPAPKVLHCTVKLVFIVPVPQGEWTHELHLFMLRILLRAGFGECAQENTDGEEGWPEVDTRGVKGSG